MLVLSRSKEEEIVIMVPPSTITQRITIKVVDIRGYKVRLGTTAAREVRVDRTEVYESKQAARRFQLPVPA